MSLRRVILAVAAVMALPSCALAQRSRVEGMSLPGDYINDYTVICVYTLNAPSVGDLVQDTLGDNLESVQLSVHRYEEAENCHSNRALWGAVHRRNANTFAGLAASKASTPEVAEHGCRGVVRHVANGGSHV